ncbi:hypothetical protein ACHHYP_20018 [Achlya hypogyna]|uniref:Secreted protein n=1 Tax=Achlya hypogyna TaxID=1202772 RepID=A0A1V9ZUH2_ACHHY|nr:hypothetical protein ACHHYP_20018 [Achlya hypogyna]
MLLLASVVAAVAMAAAEPLPPVLPQALAKAVDTFKPVIATYAATALPATMGNCSADAPKPCQEIGDLYNTKTSFYDVRARWISGLNTLTVDTLSLTYDAVGTVTATAAVTFKSLPLSLRVDACLPSAGCSKLLDNTETCCGGPKTITVVAVATCNETYPFLRDLNVTRATISPALQIMVNVSGTPTGLFDATSLVQNELMTQGSTLLQKQALEPLNDKVRAFFGSTVFCTQESQLAWLAKHPQANDTATTSSPAAPKTSSANTSSVALLVFALAVLVHIS